MRVAAASTLPDRVRDSRCCCGEERMDTRTAEIADGIYRLSTFVPEIAPPAGFTFNQFLVLGDEPLLFHTGLRRMFPLGPRRPGPDHPTRAAALDRLRPLRGRRVRRHERVARGSAAGAGGARADRLPRLAQRHGRPRAAHPGRWRGDRPRRRQALALHRHAARPARLGRRRDARGERAAPCSAATCSPSSATALP